MINTNILQKIEKNAFIIRKYNLGDESYFYSKFPVASKTVLEIIWKKGKKKVQNKEIIKTSNELNQTELNFVNKRFLQFENNTEKLYDYLISEFDYKKLKFDEENIERKLRNLLSEKFIELSSKEIPKEIKKDDEIRKEKKKKKESRIINSLVLIALFTFLFGSTIYELGLTIYDGFTPVKQLTERIHERSKYKFSGSICNDGTTSYSQGRGTCSWHRGVNYEFYEGDYAKSIEECKSEAIKSSWIDNLFTENPFIEQNWVGEIKKINSDEVWTTRINCKSENEISLYYPNSGCSGVLEKIKKTDNKIFFREKLETGNDICTDNGKVIIEIGENNLIFYYCWPNDNIIVAKGILQKEK